MLDLRDWAGVGEIEEGSAAELVLLQAGQAGDRGALEQLLTPNKRPLFALCHGILGHPDDAEDAAQAGARSAGPVPGCAFKATALSDLCDRFRAQTGIQLSAGPCVADEKVTVFCEKLPLREAGTREAGGRQLSRPFGYTWLRSRQPTGWSRGSDRRGAPDSAPAASFLPS